MSEEKLYVVKNDEGKYWDFRDPGKFWELSSVFSSTTNSKEQAELVADERGGYIVTFIEETEKVALTKEQAEIVEEARIIDIPATYISDRTDEHNGEKILGEEILLIKALTNGYTVAKEKKYVVYKELCGKQNKDSYTGYAQAFRALSNSETMFWVLTKWITNDQDAKFTEKEITDFGLQDCEKEEVTDDD